LHVPVDLTHYVCLQLLREVRLSCYLCGYYVMALVRCPAWGCEPQRTSGYLLSLSYPLYFRCYSCCWPSRSQCPRFPRIQVRNAKEAGGRFGPRRRTVFLSIRECEVTFVEVTRHPGIRRRRGG